MESIGPSTIISKKLRHILRVVYCMLRKSFISRRKLMLDLLKHRKIVGKSMAHTSTFNSSAIAFSCNIQREVEFNCSNTPSYSMFLVNRRKNRKHGRCESYDFETSSVDGDGFEMLDDDEGSDADYSILNSHVCVFGKSPMMVRQPFPIIGGDEVVDERVDKQAEEFIKRFYEQLKIQQRTQR